MRSSVRLFVVICLALGLYGCGSGGGGGTSNPNPTPPSQPATESFSITLENLDVSRISNGNAIVVDTSGVNSGVNTYQPR